MINHYRDGYIEIYEDGKMTAIVDDVDNTGSAFELIEHIEWSNDTPYANAGSWTFSKKKNEYRLTYQDTLTFIGSSHQQLLTFALSRAKAA